MKTERERDLCVVVPALLALLLVVRVAAAQSNTPDTLSADWQPFTSASKDVPLVHLVDVSSIQFDYPIATYRLQYAFVAPVYNARATTFNVQSDCAAVTRRETAAPASAPTGEFRAARELGASYVAEVVGVCQLARSRRAANAAPGDPTPKSRDGARGSATKPHSTKRSALSGIGSGFLVDNKRIVTNHHVVEDCANVVARLDSVVAPAEVIASTKRSDLALLAVDLNMGTPAAIRLSASLGEAVTVAGFPLAGLLSDDIIVTGGQVNSLAGLRNDPVMLQISAPVQPGNSGGPLVDRSGAIVGVVVSKLDVEKVSKLTGDMAQNVNFAIKPEVLRLFLTTNRVAFRTSTSTQKFDGAQVAQRARQFTVQILCER